MRFALLPVMVLAIGSAAFTQSPDNAFQIERLASPPNIQESWIERPSLGGARTNLDFMLGTISGARLQYRLGDLPDSGWMAEGVAGLLVIFPTVGAGVRYRGIIHEGKANSLSIEPGADVYAFYAFDFFSNSATGGAALGFDVDLL
jgi:hypothetical protein